MPNDTRPFVKECLEQIWKTEGRAVITKTVYTDNVSVDTSVIKATFKECHGAKKAYPEICQVYYINHWL